MAVVSNLSMKPLVLMSNSYRTRRTSGVAMHVGQAFLHETKHSKRDLPGEAVEIVRDLNRSPDLAALRESFDIAAESQRKSDFVQQRWMQKIGDGTDLRIDLVHDPRVLSDHLRYLG